MFITISTEYHPRQCHFELFGQLIQVGEISLKIYRFLQISNFTALSTDWATDIDYCFLCSPDADKRFWTIQFLITPSSCSVPYQWSYHPCQWHFKLFGQLIPIGETSLKIYRFIQISISTALSLYWATDIDYCFLCSPDADKRFWTIQFLITPSSCSVPYQRSYCPCQWHFKHFGQLNQLGKYHSKSTDLYRSRYPLPYHCTELLILTIVFSVSRCW